MMRSNTPPRTDDPDHLGVQNKQENPMCNPLCRLTLIILHRLTRTSSYLPLDPQTTSSAMPSTCLDHPAFAFGTPPRSVTIPEPSSLEFPPPPLCKSGASVTMQVPKIEPKYQGRAEKPTRQTPVEDLGLLSRQHFAEEI